MTDRATLAALVARVEAATGPSRALDAEIARAIGWTGVHGSPLDDGFMGGKPPGGNDWLHIPGFSGSLDAAAALVPEGLYWEVSAAHDVKRASAIVNTPFRVFAATPALALCAAALRARMEMLDD